MFLDRFLSNIEFYESTCLRTLRGETEVRNQSNTESSISFGGFGCLLAKAEIKSSVSAEERLENIRQAEIGDIPLANTTTGSNGNIGNQWTTDVKAESQWWANLQQIEPLQSPAKRTVNDRSRGQSQSSVYSGSSSYKQQIDQIKSSSENVAASLSHVDINRSKSGGSGESVSYSNSVFESSAYSALEPSFIASVYDNVDEQIDPSLDPFSVTEVEDTQEDLNCSTVTGPAVDENDAQNHETVNGDDIADGKCPQCSCAATTTTEYNQTTAPMTDENDPSSTSITGSQSLSIYETVSSSMAPDNFENANSHGTGYGDCNSNADEMDLGRAVANFLNSWNQRRRQVQRPELQKQLEVAQKMSTKKQSQVVNSESRSCSGSSSTEKFEVSAPEYLKASDPECHSESEYNDVRLEYGSARKNTPKDVSTVMAKSECSTSKSTKISAKLNSKTKDVTQPAQKPSSVRTKGCKSSGSASKTKESSEVRGTVKDRKSVCSSQWLYKKEETKRKFDGSEESNNSKKRRMEEKFVERSSSPVKVESKKEVSRDSPDIKCEKDSNAERQRSTEETKFKSFKIESRDPRLRKK